MSQHDLSIANQGFPAFRSDLNDALQALGSMQSGTTAPSTTYANMLWYDTTNNIVKMRNEDNDAWISLLTLDQSGDLVSEISAGKFIGTDTTDASSTTAAAVKTAGGLAVAKKLYVGTGGAVVEGLTVGKGAGSVATNTAVGASALAANTTGLQSTSVGYFAGKSVTTANNITAFGYNAAAAITTGGENVAVGALALQTATTASENTAVGVGSMANTTTGSYNAAFGRDSLVANTTGQFNIAVGRESLKSNTTAANNTAVGFQAGYTNSTGAGQAFFGYQTGYSATGGYNTFIGNSAGYYVTSGTKNTILGRYDGNQGGLDIRTSSNYIVLSDGDGNPRYAVDNSAQHYTTSPNNGTLYKAYDCRAWVNFNGTGTVAIRGSGNVSSITDNGVANYTLNFSTAMPDVNYCLTGMSGNNDTSLECVVQNYNTSAPATSSVRVRVARIDGTMDVDPPIVCVSIFR